MRCKKYRKLLHLNRPGELTERQQMRLARHLAHCQDCAAELRRIQNADATLRQLREFKPELKEPEKLTNEIVQEARGIKSTMRRNPFENFVDGLLDIIEAPKVRFAMAGFVILLVASFFIQEFTVLYRISNLEKRVAMQHKNQDSRYDKVLAGANALYTYSTSTRQEIYSDLVPLHQKIDEDLIIVDKKRLASLVETNLKLRKTNKLLLKVIEEISSEASDVVIEDGITKSELDFLLSRREEIIKLLRRL